MDCTECGNDVVLVKKPRVRYDGIRVENVFLRNCEVEVCRHCGAESPVVRNIKKVHLMIAVGIAIQPARVSGEELRFLRKAVRLNMSEWADHIGIADGTFSRWENGRSPAEQVEKLARIDFLVRAATIFPSAFEREDAIVEVLNSEISDLREFAIVVDVDDLESRPQYDSLKPSDLLEPVSSFVDAYPNLSTLFAPGKISFGEIAIPKRSTGSFGNIEDTCYARGSFEITA